MFVPPLQCQRRRAVSKLLPRGERSEGSALVDIGCGSQCDELLSELLAEVDGVGAPGSLPMSYHGVDVTSLDTARKRVVQSMPQSSLRWFDWKTPAFLSATRKFAPKTISVSLSKVDLFNLTRLDVDNLIRESMDIRDADLLKVSADLSLKSPPETNRPKYVHLICMEVFEHLDCGGNAISVMLDKVYPDFSMFSTPNFSFNRLFSDITSPDIVEGGNFVNMQEREMRHAGHVFELTRTEFEAFTHNDKIYESIIIDVGAPLAYLLKRNPERISDDDMLKADRIVTALCAVEAIRDMSLCYSNDSMAALKRLLFVGKDLSHDPAGTRDRLVSFSPCQKCLPGLRKGSAGVLHMALGFEFGIAIEEIPICICDPSHVYDYWIREFCLFLRFGGATQIMCVRKRGEVKVVMETRNGSSKAFPTEFLTWFGRDVFPKTVVTFVSEIMTDYIRERPNLLTAVKESGPEYLQGLLVWLSEHVHLFRNIRFGLRNVNQNEIWEHVSRRLVVSSPLDHQPSSHGSLTDSDDVKDTVTHPS